MARAEVPAFGFSSLPLIDKYGDLLPGNGLLAAAAIGHSRRMRNKDSVNSIRVLALPRPRQILQILNWNLRLYRADLKTGQEDDAENSRENAHLTSISLSDCNLLPAADVRL